MGIDIGSRAAWFAVTAILACAAYSISYYTAAAAEPTASAASLVLIDGRTISVPAVEISQGQIKAEGAPAGLMLDDLRRIEWTGPSTAAAPAAAKAVAIDLVGGGKLFGTGAAIFDDKCSLDWPLSERVSFPMDALRGLRLGTAPMTPEFEKALANPAADQDRIFIVQNGKPVSATGLVESLSEKQIAFEFEGASRTYPRENLVGIVFAQPAADDARLPATVLLRDGSRVGCELVSLAGGKLTMKLPGEVSLQLPAAAVRSINLRSSRMEFLSDLKPTEVQEQAIVTLPRPWQKNRSTLGRPLTVGTRVFENGIGVHARSQLTFATDGKYDLLAGVIGIDAETGGRGDCVFTVLGDGERLFTQRMKGAEPGKEIRIDIRGRRQVTLVVEPGEDLDLADHADWCDIRFIKTRNNDQ